MARNQRVLRSWFWNIIAAIVLTAAAGGCTVLALHASVPTAVQILLGVIALVLVVGAARMLTLGVRATPEALVVRELFRTTRLRWSAVKRAQLVTHEPQTFGAPSVAMPMPELHVELDGRHDRILVTSLGAHRLTVAQRNVEALNDLIRSHGRP